MVQGLFHSLRGFDDEGVVPLRQCGEIAQSTAHVHEPYHGGHFSDAECLLVARSGHRSWAAKVAAFDERLFEGTIVPKDGNWNANWIESDGPRKLRGEPSFNGKRPTMKPAFSELSVQWQAVQRLDDMLNDLLTGSHDPAALTGERSIDDWTLLARGAFAEPPRLDGVARDERQQMTDPNPH